MWIYLWHFRTQLFGFLFSLSLLCSCASTPEEDFQRIQQGAKKGYVLGVLGNPTRTYRKNNIDHWVYEFTSEQGNFSKKIYLFKEGRVIKMKHKIPAGQPKDSDFKEI